MAYIVFDLDETLAELYPTFYFVASLKPDVPHTLPDEFKSELDRAYKSFLQRVLAEEQLDAPLGILRPGILKVFETIQTLKSNGQVNGVVIYSNNGHLESLEFIRDIIHQHLNTTSLILECIHWGHDMRQEERGRIQGAASKTWKVLSSILKGPIIGAPPDLSPNSVYFFDDQSHPDLKTYLKDNYIKVPSYTFKASVNTLARLFTEAFDSANVNKKQFISIQSELLGITFNTIEEVIDQFKRLTKGTSKGPASNEEDTGIKLMKDTFTKISTSFKRGGGIKRKRRSWDGNTRRQRIQRSKKHKRRYTHKK
jgi:hypothetical protein